ncbi:ArsR/SmtB family transcription factor [Pseudaquidulcibacter saccharophilus]|uniref:ArsR/SmtB family transcription factor n=1 Tax=Pseudaquidulcibacter saccharophilus TaxID=2831900 RepID=UPI001EFF333F|nr:metalloregulator ArsR/SmtB family transcription factor [Pseudaquidulcibacter saccharophilus]
MNKIDLIFHALSDETRRNILTRLCDNGAVNNNYTINELAKPFDISLPAISKHIKVLEKAGLVIRGKDRQFRPISINYSAFREIDQFLAFFRRGANLHNARLAKLGAEEFFIKK